MPCHPTPSGEVLSHASQDSPITGHIGSQPLDFSLHNFLPLISAGPFAGPNTLKHFPLGLSSHATHAAPSSSKQTCSHSLGPSFKDHFLGPRSSKFALQYFPPSFANKVIVELSPAIVVEGCKLWNNSLVGKFLGKKPLFSFAKSTIERLWCKKEIPHIVTYDNGLMNSRSVNSAARDWVLESRPWHIGSTPIFLSPWRPKLETSNLCLSKIPIWVKLLNIPLEYWTECWIASAIGKPLHVDSNTESLRRISFVRVCVEIDVDSPLPSSFGLMIQ
ncbi:DUF4283 domain-containing protein [Cephalotus follicularis]|uniref:DUF4283 domain-containing protein n=1 Tax=Cephalotus follicularis TaxID=3775 RepID=A0A1Q3DAS7_CEPFO|nr:DUF4283 domain-containing protein [Cephalotus follicularis]